LQIEHYSRSRLRLLHRAELLGLQLASTFECGAGKDGRATKFDRL
jgi:hypothetical protein